MRGVNMQYALVKSSAVENIIIANAAFAESIAGDRDQIIPLTIEDNADGTLKAITTVFKNRTRTEIFNYNNRRLSGATTTEVQA